MTIYSLSSKEWRRFHRRMRASSFSLKCGADMGIYGHFTRPVEPSKLAGLIEKIKKDMTVIESEVEATMREIDTPEWKEAIKYLRTH